MVTIPEGINFRGHRYRKYASSTTLKTANSLARKLREKGRRATVKTYGEGSAQRWVVYVNNVN